MPAVGGCKEAGRGPVCASGRARTQVCAEQWSAGIEPRLGGPNDAGQRRRRLEVGLRPARVRAAQRVSQHRVRHNTERGAVGSGGRVGVVRDAEEVPRQRVRAGVAPRVVDGQQRRTRELGRRWGRGASTARAAGGGGSSGELGLAVRSPAPSGPGYGGVVERAAGWAEEPRQVGAAGARAHVAAHLVDGPARVAALPAGRAAEEVTRVGLDAAHLHQPVVAEVERLLGDVADLLEETLPRLRPAQINAVVADIVVAQREVRRLAVVRNGVLEERAATHSPLIQTAPRACAVDDRTPKKHAERREALHPHVQLADTDDV